MPSKPRAAKIGAIKIPARVVNGLHSDSVRWSAIDRDGKEVGKWNNSACYSGIMTRLGDYEIHCRPHWDRGGGYKLSAAAMAAPDKDADDRMRDAATSLLPGGLYKSFWNYCKETGLVPEEVEVSVKDRQNHLVIPRLGWDRHTAYASLSLYRHCDCQPRMPATAVLLYRKLRKQGVHFLQCLHYAMADLAHVNSGHVFITMEEKPGSYYGNCGGRNLAAGLAMARFARMPMEERKKLGNGMTYAMFCKLAKDLNPVQTKAPSGNGYSSPPREGLGRPKYILKTKEHILSPKFAPFYENPDLTLEEFAEAMEGECE